MEKLKLLHDKYLEALKITKSKKYWIASVFELCEYLYNSQIDFSNDFRTLLIRNLLSLFINREYFLNILNYIDTSGLIRLMRDMFLAISENEYSESH